MTNSAPIHHLVEVVRLFGDEHDVAAELHCGFRGYDDGVEPLHLTEAPLAEDHSDVSAVDLAAHLREMAILWQTVCIRRIGRHLQDSHSNLLPARSHDAAPGKNRTQELLPSSEFDSAPQPYGVRLFHFWNFATGAGAA
jgi:hypothetical protein